MLGTPDESNWPEVTSMPDFGKILFKENASVPLLKHIMNKYDATEESIDNYQVFEQIV